MANIGFLLRQAVCCGLVADVADPPFKRTIHQLYFFEKSRHCHPVLNTDYYPVLSFGFSKRIEVVVLISSTPNACYWYNSVV